MVLSEEIAELRYDTGQKFLIGFESGDILNEKQQADGEYPRIRLYVWDEYKGEMGWNGWLPSGSYFRDLAVSNKSELDVDELIMEVDSLLKGNIGPHKVPSDADMNVKLLD
jgi:hypothetical protein